MMATGRAGAPRGGPGESALSGGAAFQVERERVGPLPLWGWALATSFLVWVLYLVTLAPSTAFWDASEYIATAHILGIPHPPGNPFFVMVGRVWDVMLAWTGISVAERINLLSATASAGATGFWFLSIVRIWAHFTESRRQLLVVGIVSVLVGATAFTVWSQSNVNEKVYTLSLLVVAVVTYVAMLWEDVADSPRGDRLVLLVAFLLGLGASNHLMSLLPVGALGLFVLFHRPRTFLRGRLISAGLLLAVLGYSVQVFFVPIRSAQEPMIDEADPGCESLWKAAVTPLELLPVVERLVPDDAACEPLRAALAREQYGGQSVFDRQAPFTAQVANYGQYFNWQWARTLPAGGQAAATVLFVLLGLIGLWRHWKGDRDSFIYFATLLVTVIPLLIFYLNFRYGYSMYPEIPMGEHEVRERDYFFIVSFNLWGLYAGMGLVTLWQSVAGRLAGAGGAGSEGARGARRGGALPGDALLKASPVLGLALVPLLFNFGLADRSGDYSARDWAYNVLQSVEPYGVVFTNGDNDTFPLWYLQEVEGVRQDVIVAVHSYLGTKWYPKQLRRMSEPCPEGVDPSDSPTVVTCQRPFDVDAAVGPYRDLDPDPPERSVLDLTDEEVDQLPAVERADEGMSLAFSESVTGTLRSGAYVSQADLLVFLMSRQSLGDRPVYFAATAPPVFGKWQLGPHLMRQGLGFRVVDGPLEDTADTVSLEDRFSVSWIDRERSNALLWDVFQVDYLLDWDLWPEPSTRGSIPAQYYLAYFAQGEAQRLRNRPERADMNYRRSEDFLELGNLNGGAREP